MNFDQIQVKFCSVKTSHVLSCFNILFAYFRLTSSLPSHIQLTINQRRKTNKQKKQIKHIYSPVANKAHPFCFHRN